MSNLEKRYNQPQELSPALNQSETKPESPILPQVAYPLKAKNNTNISQQYFNRLAGDESARFLFNNSGMWHQGIHLRASKFPSSEFEHDKICAIADGKLIAYKVDSEYKEDVKAPYKSAVYSTGFFLLKHQLSYPKENVLTFYSLYRHTAKIGDYPHKAQFVTKSADKNPVRIKNRRGLVIANLMDGLLISLKSQHKKALRHELASYQDENGAIHRPPKGEIWTIYKDSYQISQQHREYALPILTAKKIETEIDKEVFLPAEKQIEVKAGDELGLMGEYNQMGESGEKLLHLEVFTYDDIEQFKAKTETAYKRDKEKKGIKDNFLYVARGSQLYSLIDNKAVELAQTEVEIMVPIADVAKKTLKDEQNPKKTKDYYNVLPYLYQLTENQQENGIYVDDSHLTHGILFPGMNVFQDQTDEISIFKHKIAGYLDPESGYSMEEKETLELVFKSILEELDFDKGQSQDSGKSRFEAGKLKGLLLNAAEQRRLTGIVVQHKSEWAKSQVSKFDELIALARKLNDNEAADKIQTRVVDLGISLKAEGFDSERKAYYFHPLGMIGWLSILKSEKRCFCYEQGLMSSTCSEGTPVLEQHYEALSKELGVEKEVLKAVAEVESKGKGFIRLNGERRAKILYERHYMYRKLAEKKSDKYDLKRLSLDSPNIVNKSVQPRGTYGSEEHQYEKLAIAKNIDNDSAIQSCSWGKFQVMGSYYSYGGYTTASELEEAMHLCELQQFVYFKNFLSKVSPKIIKPMREKNWAAIAETYNGPNYRDGAYDVKMRNAYNKYIALKNK